MYKFGFHLKLMRSVLITKTIRFREILAPYYENLTKTISQVHYVDKTCLKTQVGLYFMGKS